MQKTFYKPQYFLCLILVLCVLLFFRLGSPSIYILDEAKNAQCAREMLQRKDFIVPTFNDVLRTDKPPLHYFFMMLSYKIFGVNEFAARFFSAVFGVLTVVLTYFFSKKFLNNIAAFFTSLVLCTSTHFLFEFRLAVPDPYLIFFITAGLFSGFAWLQGNKKIYLFITSAVLALATLAKGPVAIVLPGLCFFIWVIWKKKWKIFFSWQLIPAFVLLCAIAAPWYFAVDKATNGEWTKGFFINNNLNRFSDPQEGHGGFFLLPLTFVLIGLLPFAIFTGEIFKKRHLVFKKELVQFSFIVVAVFIIFFSISSTMLPNYPMPCYPFAAVIIGNYISLLFTNNFYVKKYPFYILLAVMIALPVAGYFAVGKEAETASLQNIVWLLLIPAILFFIFFITTLPENLRRNFFALVACYVLFNGIGLYFIYPKLYSQNPVSKTIDLVKKSASVFAFGEYNPGYNFYLNKNIRQFQDLDSLKNILQQNPDAVIISRSEMADSLKKLPLQIISSHHDIFELPTTIILKQNAKP